MSFNAYYNGKFTSIGEVALPLTDRSVFFGDGIYDAAIGRNGKIFLEEEHTDRFLKNAEAVNIPLPLPRASLIEVLRRLASDFGEGAFFIYFQLSRFSEKRTHSYADTEKSNLLVTTTPTVIKPPSHTLSLTATEDIRHSMCNIKTLNLLPAVLASKRAEREGADEAVFLRGDTVTECAHSNVHIIKDGRLITHPLNNLILPGISRAHLLRTARRLSVPVEERPFTLGELRSADEVLISSSSKLCLRAKSFCDVSYDTENRRLGLELCTKMHTDFIKMTQ